MRLGFFQMRPRFGDVSHNVDKIERALQDVRRATVVLPELCTTGYVFESRREARSLAEPADSPTTQRMKALAHRNRLTLCWGFAEADGQRVYNSCALITPTGRLHVYRKAHLFDREKLCFDRAQSHLQVVRGTTTFGMMICFDWVFPEVARSLALSGARVLLHPSNLVMPYCQAAMTTRTLENGVFAVTCNRVGEESRSGVHLRFTGRSQIVDPKGKILARAGVRGEKLVLVEIDPKQAHDKRISSRNHLFRDRRPDLYGKLI